MIKMLYLYFKRELVRLYSIFRGMSITIKYLLVRSPITEKYPMVDNRAGELPARFRGQLALISERRASTNEPDCIDCKMCEKVCPNRSIVIEMAPQKHADGKTMPQTFDWNYSTCIFCNLCVEACNFDALTFVTTFEGANQNREKLLWDMNDLVHAYTESKRLGHKRSYDEFWEQKKKKEEAQAAAKKAAAASAIPTTTSGTASPSPATNNQSPATNNQPPTTKAEGTA